VLVLVLVLFFGALTFLAAAGFAALPLRFDEDIVVFLSLCRAPTSIWLGNLDIANTFGNEALLTRVAAVRHTRAASRCVALVAYGSAANAQAQAALTVLKRGCEWQGRRITVELALDQNI
jgi:hypothetical protein